MKTVFTKPVLISLGGDVVDPVATQGFPPLKFTDLAELRESCRALIELGAPNKGYSPSILNQAFCVQEGSYPLYVAASQAAELLKKGNKASTKDIEAFVSSLLQLEVGNRLSLEELVQSFSWEARGYATYKLCEAFNDLMQTVKDLPVDINRESPFLRASFLEPLSLDDALKYCKDAELTGVHPVDLYREALASSDAFANVTVFRMYRPGMEKVIFETTDGTIIKLGRIATPFDDKKREASLGQRSFDLTPIRTSVSLPMIETSSSKAYGKQSREVVALIVEQPKALLGAPTRWEHALVRKIREDGCYPHDIEFHLDCGYLGCQMGLVPDKAGNFEVQLIDYGAVIRTRGRGAPLWSPDV